MANKNNKICSIIFAPHCQVCGRVIIFPVSIVETPNLYGAMDYEIYPERCSNCGARFTGIVAPKNLYETPYDISDMFDRGAS